jgi:hypothetical protein
VRLCLDEHYARAIAEQLRDRHQDVISVKERQDLVGISDRDLLRTMQAETRALLTENVGDFMPLVHELAAAGENHWGVVFTSPRSMPRGAATIGLYVEALDGFLRERPADDDLQNQVSWLQPPG